MAGTGFGPFTAMGDGRYGVEHIDRGHWRAVYRDELGEWAMTGPAMRTKAEAMAFWFAPGQVAAVFGEGE